MGASPGATANERFTESTLMSPALEREPLQRGQLSDEEAIRLPTGSCAGAGGSDSLLVHVWWMFCNVAIHAMWGFYPVAARWLQTRPEDPLPPLRLTFYINLVACVALATCVSAPQAALRGLRIRHRGGGSSAAHAPVIGLRGVDQGHPTRRQKVIDVLVLAVSLGVLGAGAVSASRFTSAYLVQLVFTTSPLWTSLVGAAAVREAPPPLLWPVFAVTVAGSVVVVAGGLRSATHAVTWRDPLGLLIALAATLAISVYFVWVAKTRAWLAESAILYINYAAVFSFAPSVSALFEGGEWGALRDFTGRDWCALLYAGAGVYGFAKFTQQLVIRRLGASVYSLFISIRLVAAIAGSSLILGETVGWVEALGCAVVCAGVSYYIWADTGTAEGQAPTVASA
eukprot:CAMPEP_0206137062 /NCGR_PEP_ID=MMETSP1473-20131121/2239_1 /ASSEMBLY_ACC=CAM_ASM_001109 /TAXON_ID=1461547 /ORGANISM="Stichococcus sp, Strain RCC1054" /LENGTH=397 /DNA_ID=CAMNT_0053529957 /DNA_START=235 /DNA_END=1428 /DNA_ORIENTATION=+